MGENANKQIKMADLQLVDFALMPGPVRKENQFGLPDDTQNVLHNGRKARNFRSQRDLRGRNRRSLASVT